MTHQDFGRVAVLLGGRSAEREVSLNSGGRVLAALLRQGVKAEAFDPETRSLEDLRAFDRVFIALHGGYGEDGSIQGYLQLIGVPFTGSGVLASALGMDKWRTKLVWQALGMPVPPYALLREDSDFAEVEEVLGLPLFVKPAREGSSVGVTKVSRSGELGEAYAEAARHDSLVLAEQAIGGAPGTVAGEYTVGILERNGKLRALPIIKIEPATEFYDYEAKYNRDDTRYRCPCGLPASREAELGRLAEAAFEAVGGRGWGRVDFLMDEAGDAYLLEVNTAPGMTDHSLVPMAARQVGLDYDQLVMEVLAAASLG